MTLEDFKFIFWMEYAHRYVFACPVSFLCICVLAFGWLLLALWGPCLAWYASDQSQPFVAEWLASNRGTSRHYYTLNNMK